MSGRKLVRLPQLTFMLVHHLTSLLFVRLQHNTGAPVRGRPPISMGYSAHWIYLYSEKVGNLINMWETDEAKPSCTYANLCWELKLGDLPSFENFSHLLPDQFQCLEELVSPLVRRKTTNYQDSISQGERLMKMLRSNRWPHFELIGCWNKWHALCSKTGLGNFTCWIFGDSLQQHQFCCN